MTSSGRRAVALLQLGLGFLCAEWLGCAPGLAQTLPPTLASEPDGVQIMLQGPARLSGVTPLALDDLPDGEYRLVAREPGLPAARARLTRTGSGLAQRSWAGATALFFPPGVIHLERGESRGWVFLGAAAAGLSMTLVSESRRGDAIGTRDRLGREYTSTESEVAIEESRFALEKADDKVADMQEMRDLWIAYLGASAGGAFLESVLLTADPHVRAVADGGYIIGFPSANRLLNGVRSALVPGAGQRFMGHEKRANLFALASGVLGAAAVSAHSEFLEARRDQDDAQRRFLNLETEEEIRAGRKVLEKAEEKTDDAELLQWSIAGAAGAVYLWNVLDAIGSGGAREEAPASLSLLPHGGGVTLRASWRIG